MVMARRLQRQETVLTSFLWLRHRLLDQQPNKTVLNRFIKNSYNKRGRRENSRRLSDLLRCIDQTAGIRADMASDSGTHLNDLIIGNGKTKVRHFLGQSFRYSAVVGIHDI